MRDLLLLMLLLGVSRSAIAQVNLPEGFEIVEFAVNDKKTGPPAINNCGEIVYVKDHFEDSRVYLYDNGKITRLTDYDAGRLVSGPDINDGGTIVWLRGFFNEPDTWRIVMLKDGDPTVVGQGAVPSINNLDRMSWQVVRGFSCNVETDILYYDGNSALPITDDRFNNQSSQINDHDWITWGRSDHCVNPWVGEIPLYRDGREIVLPSSDSQPQVPAINNLGQVAWFMGGVEVWENGVTRLLTEWGGNPELNNLGDILFYRWHDDLRSDDAWLYRVSDGDPTFHRLTAERRQHTVGDINDWVEATWRWYEDPLHGEWGGGVRYLRRIRTGDADFDGDVELTDYAVLAECMTGPGRVDRLCDCRFLDIDHDGDVDLADFARFQNGFTGGK